MASNEDKLLELMKVPEKYRVDGNTFLKTRQLKTILKDPIEGLDFEVIIKNSLKALVTIDKRLDMAAEPVPDLKDLFLLVAVGLTQSLIKVEQLRDIPTSLVIKKGHNNE